MPELTRFAADGLLLVVLGVSVPVVLYAIRRQFWQAAPIVAMAALTSLLVGKLASLIYQPSVARPFLELGAMPGATYIDNPGFPSDHALLATVAVVAVWFTTRHKGLTVLLGTMVVIMSTARVAALVHTPFDVIAGMIAGVSGAVWYHKIDKYT